MEKRYRFTSWIDPRIKVKISPLGGKGIFAIAPINKDEVVIVWGGKLFTKEDIKKGRARKHTYAAIDENLYLGASLTEKRIGDPSNYINHSCDPNIWMQNEVTLVSRRDLKAGEELTADYAMWEADEEWVCPWECHCGSKLCRKRVTGKDWRLKELQKRYKGHFSPFINKRIEKLSESKN